MIYFSSLPNCLYEVVDFYSTAYVFKTKKIFLEKNPRCFLKRNNKTVELKNFLIFLEKSFGKENKEIILLENDHQDEYILFPIQIKKNNFICFLFSEKSVSVQEIKEKKENLIQEHYSFKFSFERTLNDKENTNYPEQNFYFKNIFNSKLSFLHDFIFKK